MVNSVPPAPLLWLIFFSPVFSEQLRLSVATIFFSFSFFFFFVFFLEVQSKTHQVKFRFHVYISSATVKAIFVKVIFFIVRREEDLKFNFFFTVLVRECHDNHDIFTFRNRKLRAAVRLRFTWESRICG